jgi:TRAP-type C4-dicarboxylate transport system substrate-binding protein
MLILRAVTAVILVAALPAVAAAQSVTLDLINEYPATSISGEADSFFAAAVKRHSDNQIIIRPIPDAKSGLRSREQLKAVSENRFALANTVGGTLGDENPVFLLSSLPFVAPTLADARRLAELALPLYEQAFAARQQKLLFIVPWPPSGIWSAARLDGLAALKALKIRTYDNTGTEVMARATAHATMVSFSDLDPKLQSGEINAVLSSGDGGAGRQLWKYLPYFAAINYTVTLSFVTISRTAWDGLDDAGRAAITAAAREAGERQWSVLTARLEENFARMRQNGVTIDEKPPTDVMEPLRAAADASLAEWLARVGPEARQVYEAYRKAH